MTLRNQCGNVGNFLRDTDSVCQTIYGGFNRSSSNRFEDKASEIEFGDLESHQVIGPLIFISLWRVPRAQPDLNKMKTTTESNFINVSSVKSNFKYCDIVIAMRH